LATTAKTKRKLRQKIASNVDKGRKKGEATIQFDGPAQTSIWKFSAPNPPPQKKRGLNPEKHKILDLDSQTQ